MAEKAQELLGDGQWRPYEQVLRALMKCVPPGPAIRRAERDRVNTRANGEPRVRPRSTEDQIYSGQRSIARTFLKNRAVFESDRMGTSHGSNFGRNIRMLRPHRALMDRAPVQHRNSLIEENARLQTELRRATAEVDRLGEQIDAVAAYLSSLGHSEAARQLRSGDLGIADAAHLQE